MTPERARAAQDEACSALVEYRKVRADLPNRVRAASTLGVSRSQIARLAGMGRSTVDRMLGPAGVRELGSRRAGQTSPPPGP